MKNVLGVSIGTRHMKVTVMQNHEIVDFVSREIPENSVVNEAVVSWTALSEVLRDIYKNLQHRTKNCALVLPDSGTYVRRLQMPIMNEKQLAVNLPYEFHDVLQDDAEKYLFDYSIIGAIKDDSGKATEMDLMGATVSKKLIEQYQEMFERAGLHLIKACPRVIVLEDLVQALSKKNLHRDFALLDLGSTYTRIDIFHNGIYEVTRSIDHGINELAQAASEALNCDPHIAREYLFDNKSDVQTSSQVSAVYDSIAVEVMRALNYYTYENRDNTLDTLYYCGKGAVLSPLLDAVKASVQMPLVPLSTFDEDHAEALMESPSSVGVALGD